MDEHEQAAPLPSQDSSAQEQDSTGGLSRKLAKAYIALPPEQRTAKRRDEDGNISNAELEDAFSQMVQSYEPALPEERQREAALLQRKLDRQLQEIAVPDDPGQAARPVETGPASQLRTPDAPAIASSPQEAQVAPTLPAMPEGVLHRQAAGLRTALGWKLACLALLCLVLGMIVGQRRRQSLPMSYTSTPVPPTDAPALTQTQSAPSAAIAQPDPKPAERVPPMDAPPPTQSAQPAAVSEPDPKPAEPRIPTSPTSDITPKLPGRKSTSLSSSNPASNVVSTLTPRTVPATVGKREMPETAPLTPSLPAPMDLPTIIKPPSAAPALARTQPAPPRESNPPRISQVAAGEPTYKVAPLYPQAARNARIEGSVVMHAIIDIDGSIQQLRITSGDPSLAASAMDAVKKWRYRPYLLDGKPVEVETNIIVNFKGDNPQ